MGTIFKQSIGRTYRFWPLLRECSWRISSKCCKKAKKHDLARFSTICLDQVRFWLDREALNGRRAIFSLRVIHTSLADDSLRLLEIFFAEGKRKTRAKAQTAQGEGVRAGENASVPGTRSIENGAIRPGCDLLPLHRLDDLLVGLAFGPKAGRHPLHFVRVRELLEDRMMAHRLEKTHRQAEDRINQRRRV